MEELTVHLKSPKAAKLEPRDGGGKELVNNADRNYLLGSAVIYSTVINNDSDTAINLPSSNGNVEMEVQHPVIYPQTSAVSCPPWWSYSTYSIFRSPSSAYLRHQLPATMN